MKKVILISCMILIMLFTWSCSAKNITKTAPPTAIPTITPINVNEADQHTAKNN
ncbi:MAG TPA: hypothetical protein VN258_13540 [Mobilitalea sp.]|nr:hypothetical protein [Mobilitalea sp.]